MMIKDLEYPYDSNKLQIILGQVHSENSTKYVYKPKYLKIEGDGLFQNILITGTIGTGKTISAIVPMSLQLVYMSYNDIRKKCAMLFLDVKGTFYQFIYAFAKECGRWDDVITIELGGKYKYNPLHKPNLTEIELANRIRYILELFCGSGGSEVYWIDKAEATICELMKLIRIYNNGYINFEELHKMGTNEFYRKQKIELIDSWFEKKDDFSEIKKLNEEQQYNFVTAKAFFLDEFDKLDEKAQGYIKSEITRMTSPFISTKIVKDTFVPSKEEVNFDGFEDIIRKGKIVVWKINANKESKVAKLIAAYLKLDFQKEIMMSLEKKNDEIDKILAERIKVTVCDEYQEYCTKNDPDFFSQSREPRSITICATQSYSSLKKALQNDEIMTGVLLQSLVNKIWLRSDDVDYTIQKVINQVSKIEKEKVSRSITESSPNSEFNNSIGEIVNTKKNLSSSENSQLVEEEKFDIKFLSHDLGAGQGVCFLSDGKNIISPTVVHLISLVSLNKESLIPSNLFEGRIIFENGKVNFTSDNEKIFKSIIEAGKIGNTDLKNSKIVSESNNNDYGEEQPSDENKKKIIFVDNIKSLEEDDKLNEKENNDGVVNEEEDDNFLNGL